MTTAQRWVLAVISSGAAIACFAGAAATCAGCAAAPSPIDQAQVAHFAGDQAMCHVTTSTRADEDKCRDAVKEAYCGDGGALAAAGACGDVKLSDGGKP